LGLKSGPQLKIPSQLVADRIWWNAYYLVIMEYKSDRESYNGKVENISVDESRSDTVRLY
jgi:hypothetical protein